MVRNILIMIQNNTDQDTMPREEPSIFNYVYRNKNEDDVDFTLAQTRLKEYTEKYNQGEVP